MTLRLRVAILLSVVVLGACIHPKPPVVVEPPVEEEEETPPVEEPKLIRETFEVSDASGEHRFLATLAATDRMPRAAIAQLERLLVVEQVDPSKRKDLAFWTDTPMRPSTSGLELRLDLRKVDGPGGERQQDDGTRGIWIWHWPELFEIARPGVLVLKEQYRDVQPEPGVEPEGEVGVVRAALIEGHYERVTGTLQCTAPDGGGTVTHPIPHVRVRLGDHETVTGAAGDFDFSESFDGVPDELTLVYDSSVPSAGSTTRLVIMDEWHNGRSENVALGVSPSASDTLAVGTLDVTGGDCEIWRLGVEALEDYHATVGASPPAGALRIKRWWGVVVGGTYTYYDYLVFRADFVTERDEFGRELTLRHEFGHSIRHVADGGQSHWDWDNFRFRYAAVHGPETISAPGFAFNEGWANYWRDSALGLTFGVPAAISADGFMEFSESHIAQRLLDLETAVDRRRMVDVLTANPGAIHSLREFEESYCRLYGPNAFCSGTTPCGGAPPCRSTASLADCPPDYINDGLTCRLDNIRAKPSYGRGVGTPPTDCGSGNEYDAGLCYPECRAGFDGVGPVCWGSCPSGYHDDGLTCRRDAWIFGSDNSSCPWYDICGLTFARGCSRCPAGFHNDGCTCRRDVHIFGKESYGRGVGWIPTACSAGREYDAGLCYTRCAAGFNGVGPVCWGSCDPGYADHGATCYRAPHVISRW